MGAFNTCILISFAFDTRSAKWKSSITRPVGAISIRFRIESNKIFSAERDKPYKNSLFVHSSTSSLYFTALSHFNADIIIK